MFENMKKHMSTVAVAMVTAIVTASAPAIAHGVEHALFAHNADKVDGKHAVGAGAGIASRSGKLVATSPTTGLLPNNIIAKAPDADQLDGNDASYFTPLNLLSIPGALNDEANPVDWTKLKGVPADIADGDADSGGDITQVLAGTGLTGGGSSGSVFLSVNSAVVQSRVTGNCASSNSALVSVNGDGSVSCEADDSSVRYRTGSGAFQQITALDPNWQTIQTMTLPAGTYLVLARADVEMSEQAEAGTPVSFCRIKDPNQQFATDLARTHISASTTSYAASTSLLMQGVMTLSSQTQVELSCTRSNAGHSLYARDGNFTAIELGKAVFANP